MLLVVVRIIQGLAFGAEWGGAILMGYEHAPWRAKGRYTGIVQAGFPVGLLLANLVFLFSVHLGRLAWRVPFLASIVLVAVGLIIRSKVPESPVFEEVKEAGDDRQVPDHGLDPLRLAQHPARHRPADRRDRRLRGVDHVHDQLPEHQRAHHPIQTLTALCIAAGLGIGATLGWAALTDKIGRRPVYLGRAPSVCCGGC